MFFSGSPLWWVASGWVPVTLAPRHSCFRDCESLSLGGTGLRWLASEAQNVTSEGMAL